MAYYYPRVPNFTRFALWLDRYTEWHQDRWCWKLKGQTSQRYPNWILQLPTTCQISLRFALCTSVFELQAILRQVHRMIPTWPWTLKGFDSVLLYGQRFSNYRPVWDMCTEWPQNDGSKDLHIRITTIKFRNFTPPRSMASHFRVTGYLETFK